MWKRFEGQIYLHWYEEGALGLWPPAHESWFGYPGLAYWIKARPLSMGQAPPMCQTCLQYVQSVRHPEEAIRQLVEDDAATGPEAFPGCPQERGSF